MFQLVCESSRLVYVSGGRRGRLRGREGKRGREEGRENRRKGGGERRMEREGEKEGDEGRERRKGGVNYTNTVQCRTMWLHRTHQVHVLHIKPTN